MLSSNCCALYSCSFVVSLLQFYGMSLIPCLHLLGQMYCIFYFRFFHSAIFLDFYFIRLVVIGAHKLLHHILPLPLLF